MIANTIDALKYEQKHSADFLKSVTIPVEIDSTTEFDTEMFRVWYGMSNLGVFRKDEEGYLVEPFYGNPTRAKLWCLTADDAKNVIVTLYQASGGKM